MPDTTVSRHLSASTGLSVLSIGQESTTTSKTLVLCIHGLGTSNSDFTPLMSAVATRQPHCRLISPDLPGHGQSPASLCPDVSFSSIAALLRRLCDQEQQQQNQSGGKLVLVGHSMGCRLALEFFSLYPESVKSIILIEGNWHGPDTPRLTMDSMPPREVLLPIIMKILESMFGPHTPEWFKEEHRQMLQEGDHEYTARLTVENRRWDAERMVQVLAEVREANRSRTTRDSIPVSVVQSMESGAGGLRRPLRKGEVNSWMKLVQDHAGPSASCFVVEGCGHWPHVDKTEEVAEAIVGIVG